MSRRGKVNIKIGDYTFYMRSKAGAAGKERWCCTGNKYCKAALYTVENEVVAIHNEHNHGPFNPRFNPTQ
ncbi:unnamed protein product [Colias eurytheme]|nr:unnamed protein product [Colias eurytheme]